MGDPLKIHDETLHSFLHVVAWASQQLAEDELLGSVEVTAPDAPIHALIVKGPAFELIRAFGNVLAQQMSANPEDIQSETMTIEELLAQRSDGPNPEVN